MQIEITGIVQGVGFRPYIYALANSFNLTGNVRNSVSGVLIEVAGSKEAIEQFLYTIPKQAPPASRIEKISHTALDVKSLKPKPDFIIQVSSTTGTRTAFIPPDMDICNQCLHELFDKDDRRYLYPFINCTNCGPRYTLILDLPYDRASTSMKEFRLCDECAREYQAPDNRRFHAQPNACPKCGPAIELLNADGTVCAKDTESLHKTQSLLNQGKIVAIKGIGGFHLAANARDEQAVRLLRKKKGRPAKPLAIMCANIDIVRQLALINDAENQLISSQQKPIVLLEKKQPFPLPEVIAPSNRYIGVMLPYSPLHHLLFHDSEYDSLVMTSGNLSEEPIEIDNKQALSKLNGLADYFLVHNRDILTSNDDSVLYSYQNQPAFLRRSRSFAPAPITLDIDAGNTLAVGGSLKNTLCYTKGNQYFLSQHIGDLGHYESTEHFRSVAGHLQHMLLAEPDLVVHDLHPDYYSTRYAQSLNLERIAVQHHHAHAVSCMAENSLKGPVIAVILDGTGFGPDGTIWGGEILTADHNSYKRNAHFSQIPLPGGDAAVREPWRMALSYLLHSFDGKIPNANLPLFKEHKKDLDIIKAMIEKKVNTPLTSSCGRLFDAVSSLIGLRQQISFEGQAATDLEMVAEKSALPAYSFSIEEHPLSAAQIISFKKTIIEIFEDINKSTPKAAISRRFHETIAAALTQSCLFIRSRNNINEIVLSGGSFQNRLLLDLVYQDLTNKGFSVFTHKLVPANDAGLCLGQAIAGRSIASRIRK